MKKALQHNIDKYKTQDERSRREVKSKVGYLIMDHLRKERLPKGQPTKILMKKDRTLKIIHKLSDNAYEVELPPNLGIY